MAEGGGYPSSNISSNGVNDINRELQNLVINPVWFDWPIAPNLNEQILFEICKYLDMTGAILKNWRNLGAEFEVKTIDLDLLENAHKAGKSPSRSLFQHFSAHLPDMTFKQLLEALKKMERNDIMEEITKYMDERENKTKKVEQPIFNDTSSGVVVDGLPATSPVVTQNHCRDLAVHLGKDWKSFLHKSRLSYRIHEIEEESTELKEKSYHALMSWVNKTDEHMGNVEMLKKLFKDMKRQDLADDFHKHIARSVTPVQLSVSGVVNEYVMHSLRDEIGVDWKWVLRYLNVEENEIRIIDKNPQYNLEDKVFRGLQKWSQNNGNEATLEWLATALKAADKRHVIKKMIAAFCN